MLEGNALLAGSNTPFNGHTYTENDISAAAQVAIWTAEYGSLSYMITGGSSLSSGDFSNLVSYLTSHALPTRIGFCSMEDRPIKAWGLHLFLARWQVPAIRALH